MEALKSMSSRLLNKGDDDDEDFKQEVSQTERQWVRERCQASKEWNEQVMIFWIKKIKKKEYKRQKRLVVLTAHRLFTVRQAGNKFEVRREGHLMDLVKVHEQGLVLLIQFRAFDLQFQVSEDVDSIRILHTLYKNYVMIDPGLPPGLRCEWLDQYKASQEKELQKRVPVRTNDRGPWERVVRSFRSYCSFYNEDAEKLSGALSAMLSRELHGKDDERWVRTEDLGVESVRVLSGLVFCLAFTENLVHGVEIAGMKGDAMLFDACKILVRNNHSLKSLILDGISTGPEWGALMYECLNQNERSGLIRFGLMNCRIGEKGLTHVISGNKRLPQQPQCFYLTRTGGTSKQMVQLIQSFIGKTEYGAGLTELDISWNPLESRGTQALANRLAMGFPDLKVLRVAGCHIDVPRLLSGLEAAQRKGSVQLEHLDISHNKCTQQDGLILSRMVANAGSTATLDVANCSFDGPTVAALVASLLLNEKLEYYVSIDASMNHIGCEGAIMIASVIQETDRIASVKLNDCDLSHEGMGYLLKALENQPRLRELELDNNCKREQWTTGRYLVREGLRSLLDRAMVLECLSIKNDPERGYQVELDGFLDALKTCRNLVSLDISGNSMSNANLQTLKDVVIKNDALRELRWDNNGITARHIISITHALKQNRSLQLVEFPEKDFAKEMARVQKDRAQVMEMQLIKKNFYKALFENNTMAGFDSSPVNVKKRTQKRHSILPVFRPQGPMTKQQAIEQGMNHQSGRLGIPLPPQ